MLIAVLNSDYYWLLTGYAGLALLGWLSSMADPELPSPGARTWDSVLFGAATVYSLYFCGLREVNVGTDTPSYLQYYTLIAQESGFAATSRVRVEWLFYALVKLISATVANERFYLFVVHLLFLIPFRRFLAKVGGPNRGVLFLLYVSCFFYYSLNLNVVRNAVAIGLALPAVWYYHQKRFVPALLLLLIAVQFHFTGLIAVGSLLAMSGLPGIHIRILAVFLLVLVVAALGFKLTSLLPYVGFSSLFQAKLEGYGNRTSLYQTGFRPDFALFNLVFLGVGIQCRKNFGPDSFYYFAVTLYGLLSCAFVLSFQIPYSDRVGLWSWVLIPVIVGCPVLQKRPKNTGWLVVGAVGVAVVSLYMTRVHYQK